ncbi:hypothetical protein PHJA_002616100 [Phtheirospermum japonicum]|uniref:Uncharacterized protein n=1 Tax=Phtheirospermum japonicum TaxID=374723 RepID=A0A830CXS5_9LAMI|nr:hypothetical protein PHJA_002616100 [Phtheirospermum japonicum]
MGRRNNQQSPMVVRVYWVRPFSFSQPKRTRPPLMGSKGSRRNVSKIEELLSLGDENDDDEEEERESSGNKGKDENKDSFVMDADERKEWRQKIRDVISRTPDVEEETDLLEKRKKMQKLLAEYPLVVDEEDPDWPEDC